MQQLLGKRYSLYAALAFVIFLTVISVVSTYTAISYTALKTKIVSQIQDSSRQSYVGLHNNLLSLMEAYSPTEYDDLIKGELERKDIYAIVLDDFLMGDILGQKSFKSGKIKDANGRIIDFDPKSAEHEKWLKNCFYFKKFEIKSNTLKTVGTITIYTSDVSLNKALDDMLKESLTSAFLVSLALILALFFAIRRFIVKPIFDIVKAISVTGDDSIPTAVIPSHGSKEMFVLAKTINLMLSSIRESRQKLIESNEQTKKSNLRLQTLLEVSPVAVRVSNIDTGSVSFANEAYAKLINKELSEVTGVLPQNYYADKNEYDGIVRQIQNGYSVLQKVIKISVEGEHKWVLASYVPFEFEGEAGVLGWFYDITGERRLQEESAQLKERLELAWDGVNDGIWDWDIKKGVVYYSNRWQSMLGYSVGEVGSTPDSFFNLVHDEDKKLLGDALAKHFEDPQSFVYALQIRLRCKDGSYKWILTRGKASLDEDGNPARMVGSHTDISLQKELEKNLMLAVEEAKEANLAKGQFLANMSHEIRTPMNAIIGLSDLALSSDKSAQKDDFVQKIKHSSKLLLRIINDILDYSKVDANKLELESAVFETKKILEQLSTLFAKEAEDKKIELSFRVGEGVPPLLKGDMLRIMQVLTNLVGNAIKFTKEGFVKLDIEMLSATKESVWLRFCVKDSGIGMTKEQLDKLFLPFSQADVSTTRSYGGTGLGLAIAKKIVEAMRGSIRAESIWQKGSIFCFEIPILTTQNVSNRLTKREWVEYKAADLLKISSDTKINREAGNDAEQTLEGVRVLVVEDNEINQEITTKMLTRMGAVVDIANNGQESIRLMHKNSGGYDIVLMDIQMPIMGGYEATRIIRQTYPKIPIVALTAAALIEDKNRALEAGMNDHIAKPVDMDRLYESVFKWAKNVVYKPSHHTGTKQAATEDEIFDFEGLLNSIGGSEEMLVRLLETFSKELSQKFGDICDKLVLDDTESISMTHTLKGVAGNMRAKRVFEISKKINDHQKNGERIDITDIVALRHAIEDTLLVIKEKLSLQNIHIQKSISQDELDTLFAAVSDSLKNSEVLEQESLDLLFFNLSKKIAQKELEECKVYIENFEYDKAIAKMSEWRA